MSRVPSRRALSIAALGLALGTAAVWWWSRGSAAAPDGVGRAAAGAPRESDPLVQEERAAARQPRAEATRRLVELYARSAGDANALPARRLALDALAAEPGLALRMQRLLEAVEADTTPPERDPLWPEVVENLREQWTPETFDKGRDLMLMEKRPRARRALIESFTELAESDEFGGLTEEQRQALITDLIDMYPQADPQQKSQIEATLRKIASDDVADLLAGRGIHDGHKLKIQERYERELQAGLKSTPKAK
jgi:hypothetical protein